MMIQWQDAEIIDKKEWCPDLYSIKIKADPVTFKAGQFLNVGIEHEGEMVYRPYSLVNTPDDDLLEVHFNTVKEGRFSPILTSLEIGSPVSVPAKGGGLLTLDQVPERPHLWLCATGTGVGPFISVLRTSEAWQQFDKIVLCYATKTAEGMAYREELDALVEEYPDQFHFMPFITREEAEGTFNTRFTTMLSSGDLETHALPITADDSHFMLCGNSAMIDEMTSLLEEKGLSRHSRAKPGHIAIEKYF